MTKKVGLALSEVVKEELEKRPELKYHKEKEYKPEYKQAA